jgi:hypothetical protein
MKITKTAQKISYNHTLQIMERFQLENLSIFGMTEQFILGKFGDTILRTKRFSFK